MNANGLLANAGEGLKMLAEHGIRGVVGAGMNDIAGQDQAWRNILRDFGANVIGQWRAGQIGDLNLSPLNSALAHAGLGGVMGGMLGGTGCVTSGALGAVAGEFFANHLYMNGASIEESVKGGKIIAAFSGVLFGRNPTVSASTGANAIEHNFKKHLLLIETLKAVQKCAKVLEKGIKNKQLAKKIAKEAKKPDGNFKTPKYEPEVFNKKGKNFANKVDGSIWQKDTAGHGGEQFKRWDNVRSWKRGDQPNSIWPDGRVRK